jgi:DNA gyrase/topoisomerase IV subunit A
MVGVDTDQERARTQQLEMLDALQVAIARRVEVTEAVVSAEDQSDAVQRLRGLLEVSEVGAIHILNMEWRRFTRSERHALQDRMTDLRNRA